MAEAEALLRRLSREFAADPAATDASRVLRLPGFANKKYDRDFWVEATRYSRKTHGLADFQLPVERRDAPWPYPYHRASHPTGNRAPSQSEDDWAFARRALARGEDPSEIVKRIADYRAGEKSDPGYYARLTVSKALANLERESANSRARVDGQEDREERR
jgi:hypothetical protein